MSALSLNDRGALVAGGGGGGAIVLVSSINAERGKAGQAQVLRVDGGQLIG